ncbi:hypothetical protein WAI453_007495 [Rhynchosporium graminicola]|uniref:Uncharacterized protein n=1 Tax=Rhynchosporium graminicola TaxID=2792576 RepID=A0A1E1LKH8_9HELO|nr:uncharacterized protein RCO7_11026 [Rhynchosporium commune]
MPRTLPIFFAAKVVNHTIRGSCSQQFRTYVTRVEGSIDGSSTEGDLSEGAKARATFSSQINAAPQPENQSVKPDDDIAPQEASVETLRISRSSSNPRPENQSANQDSNVVASKRGRKVRQKATPPAFKIRKLGGFSPPDSYSAVYNKRRDEVSEDEIAQGIRERVMSAGWKIRKDKAAVHPEEDTLDAVKAGMDAQSPRWKAMELDRIWRIVETRNRKNESASRTDGHTAETMDPGRNGPLSKGDKIETPDRTGKYSHTPSPVSKETDLVRDIPARNEQQVMESPRFTITKHTVLRPRSLRVEQGIPIKLPVEPRMYESMPLQYDRRSKMISRPATSHIITPNSSTSSQQSIPVVSMFHANKPEAELNQKPEQKANPKERTPPALPPAEPSLYISLLLEDEGEGGNAVDRARKSLGYEFKGGQEIPAWSEHRIFRHQPLSSHEKYTKHLSEFAAANGPFSLELQPQVHNPARKNASKITIRFEIAGAGLENLVANLNAVLRADVVESVDPSTRPLGIGTVLAKAGLKTEEEAERLLESWVKECVTMRGRGSVLVKGLSLGLEKRTAIPDLEKREILEKEDRLLWPETKVFMFAGT